MKRQKLHKTDLILLLHLNEIGFPIIFNLISMNPKNANEKFKFLEKLKLKNFKSGILEVDLENYF